MHVPDGTPQQQAWFNDMQAAAVAEVAVEIVMAWAAMDVTGARTTRVEGHESGAPEGWFVSTTVCREPVDGTFSQNGVLWFYSLAGMQPDTRGVGPLWPQSVRMHSMPELKFVVNEKRGAIDVFRTWLPRIALVLAFIFIGYTKFNNDP